MKEHKNKIGVITINYNQAAMTIECVNSILESRHDNFFICLIDNGSSIESYEMLLNAFQENPKVLPFRIEKNRGYVGGVNAGLEEVSKHNPDYYLIMNNDTILDKDAMSELVNTSRQYDENAIVSGKVYHFDTPGILQYTGSYFSDKRYLKESYPGKDEQDAGQHDTIEKRDMLDDIFWLIPNKIYRDLGPYPDCYFMYAEQADYALQAVNKGYSLIYTPNAKIWHKGSLTTGGGNRFSAPVNFWRNKSSVIYMYRNTKFKYFFWWLVKTETKLLAKVVLNFLKLRNSNSKKEDYAALVGRFYGMKWLLGSKRENGYNPFLK